MASTRKTETVVFNGMVKWCRYNETDNYGKYSCQVYLDNDGLKKFKTIKEEKGLLNELKKDDDGSFIRVSCLPEKIMKGKKIKFVVDALDQDNEPMHDRIGNGSTAKIKMEIYPFTYGGKEKWAWRWRAIKVTQLVPYNYSTDWTKEETKTRSGLEDNELPIW